MAAAALSLSPVRAAERPVRALLSRRLAVTAPPGADALRLSVYSDGAGARLQVRLQALNNGPDVGVYYAAPARILDAKGWTTLILPLSEFTYQSEQTPSAPPAPFPMASADTLQIAVTSASTKLFLDDLAWTTAPSTPVDAPLALLDDFDALPTAWVANGDYEQVRALSFGLNRVAGFVKNGQGSLQVVVRTRAAGEKQLNGPALEARLKRLNAVPYVVYARPLLETIVPESTPAPAEIAAAPRLSLFACGDEIESTTFAVYAGRTLAGASVSIAGDLVSPDSKRSRIPAGAIDVRVVKVWDQAGAGATPELLVKDDREPLTGPAPVVRLGGDPQTTIPAQTSKQFWVTVRVPRGLTPAVYTGKLVFSAPGVKPTGIALAVEVLPFRLRAPFLQYGIDFRARLKGEANDPNVVSAEEFAAQLADIRDHGFRFVSLYDDPSALGDAFALYKASGLSPTGPVVVTAPVKNKGDIEAIEALRSQTGLSSVAIYYGRAINGGASAAAANVAGDEIAAAFTLVRKADASRGVTLNVAPVPDQATLAALGPNLDVPVYGVTSEHAQKLLVTGKRDLGDKRRDWWTWNITDENPRRNRLYTGFLLYRTGLNGSGLYGAFPGPYRQASGGDVFNETAPTTGPRPQMTTYPASNGGVIGTLQWEAAREGIDDIRYITSLKTYTRDLKDRRLAAKEVAEAEAYLTRVMARPLLVAPPADYVTIRRGIADRAIKLLRILRSSPGGYTD